MDLKAPKSYADLVTRLEEHHMVIKNRGFAEQYLKTVSYYRFTGYALQFRSAPHDSDFADNVTFEQVASLYAFDAELRLLLKKWIEILEIYFRTQISHTFAMAKYQLPPHDQHYSEANYYNKTDFQKIFENFKRQRTHYSESPVLQHHQRNYGDRLPLWVIAEMLSFSELSKLYSCMYDSEQNLIASATGTGRSVLKNHLHCLSVLRNKCAHAARLYNTDFRPSANLPPNFLRKHPDVQNNSLFAYILVVIRRLPEEHMKLTLIAELYDLVNRYSRDLDLRLMGFPENYKEVLTENR
ncbi:MAG: Abi family protein [Oscillospiraceae bacterium]|nr:Abi family protein [Oscillospiraceae bacterium]